MKKISFALIVLIGMVASALGNDDVPIVPTSLKSAIVYRSGAELIHTAKLNLQQGNQDLIIDGVSNNIDMNSVRISSEGNITIMSVSFATDYLKSTVKTPLVKKLEDSLTQVRKELINVRVSVKANQELLDLLKANKSIGGSQTGLSVAELTKMMDYYRVKTLELQRENAQLQEKENDLIEVANRLNKQIKEEEQKNNKTAGRLLLQLFSPAAGSYPVTISYVTQLASWNPAYDLRVENINKPVKLFYKAKLSQSTGLDWNKVKLTLATSMPNLNSNAPELKTWFLSFMNPLEAMNDVVVVGYGKKRAYTGSVTAVPSEEMQESVVTVRGNSSSRDGDSEPLYVVNGNIVTKDYFKNIAPQAIKDVNVLKDAAATSIYGARGSNGVVVANLKENLGDYVAVNDNQLNVTFDIELPYDIPSNGKEQNVVLKEMTVPASYRYYAAPGTDNDAYLLGEVADWEGLNLLPGEANLIVEGTYIGRTKIDPASTNDTLNLTLGKDKRVVIKKEKLKDVSSVKFLGSNKKQVFTYEISVKNNKKEAVALSLKDQYPLPTTKDIEVELLEKDGAEVDSETGMVTWKLHLAPGELKKIRFGYSVKYPKDKIVKLP